MKQTKNQSLTQNDSNSSDQNSRTCNFRIVDRSEFNSSEETSKLYDPIMTTVSLPNNDFYLQKLGIKGVYFRKDHCQKKFAKYCLKNDWESTVYQVRYGHFQSTIKMIVVNLDPKVFYHPLISKGNFGQVFLFQLKQKDYALKNIKIHIENSSVLDKALKQIFLAKIFSALEIGPQFANIFSYDAIFYKNNLQYAMEVCQTDFQKLQLNGFGNQFDNKVSILLKSLRIMHSFNICHYDIKLDNIGWSNNLNKFVFLDFGLTEIIFQPQGYKTKTKFKGTYGYCSPEMKKLHHTKAFSYIDSYYNDLHCLQVTLSQLQKIIQQTQSFRPHQSLFFPPKIAHELGDLMELGSAKQIRTKENEALARFFFLKLNIFQQDYLNVQKLIDDQTQLIQTFRKVVSLKNQESSSGSKNHISFQRIYGKILSKSQSVRQNLSLMSQLDALLYEYSIRNECKSKLVSSHRKFEQMAESKKIFDSQWENGEERQTIFNLIDVYHNNDEGLRSKLIEKVYDKISTTKTNKKQQEVSSTIKLRQILLYYFQYFSEKKDTVYLQKIVVYFELMNDEYNSEKIKQHILDTHLQDGKFILFLVDNFKFFIGSFLTVNRKMPCVSNKFIINARKLIQDKGSLLNQECKAALQFMVSFMRTIKQMQDFYKISETEYLELSRLIRQFAEKYGQQFPSEMKQLLNIIIDMRYPSSSKYAPQSQPTSFPINKLFEEIKFENLYLQKCCLKLRILNFYYNQKIPHLSSLIQTEPFLKNFLTFYHRTTLSKSSQTQIQHKKQIARAYLKIQDNPDLMIDEDYLMALDLLYTQLEIEGIVIRFFSGYDLSRIDNIQKLVNFQISLQSVFSYFFKSHQNFANDLTEVFTTFLCEVFSPFLDFTQMILKSQELKCQDEDKNYITICSLRIKKSTKYTRMYIFLLQRRAKQALDILQQIITTRKEICSEPLFLSSLCAVEQRSRPDDHARVVELMLHQAATLGQNLRFESIPIVPQFLLKILQIFSSQHKLQQAFCYIKSIFKYIHMMNLPIFRYSLVLLVTQKFLYYSCSLEDLNQMIIQELSCKIVEFCQYPKFTYVLGLAASRVKLDKVLHLRLVKVCCFFMPVFRQGWFRSYKSQFSRSRYANNPNTINSISNLPQTRLSKYTSTKKLLGYVTKQFAIRRHHHQHHRMYSSISDIREKMKQKCVRLDQIYDGI